MNNRVPTFVMMVGLPASGKSTYAKELSEEMRAVICSLDAIRKELCGDENSQDNNEEVFKLLHSRIKECLKKGVNIIYDATSINSKRRRAFLSELRNIPCIKRCVVMATPFKECCERNAARDRVVPYEVIERMYKNWNTPYWFEGWDEISLKFRDDFEITDVVGIWISDHMNFNQDNPHHSCSLGRHCALVGQDLIDDDLLHCAGLLHDCGKSFTKSFINSKGEETDVAHYYQHHCVGAYDSLFFAYPENVSRLDVSILINLHMMPYFWEKDEENGEKTRQKYQKLWGNELYNNVMTLHIADKKAH